MKIGKFYSERIKQFVSVVFTFYHVTYIDENSNIYRIKRNTCWHFDEDGIDRARMYFDEERRNNLRNFLNKRRNHKISPFVINILLLIEN